MGLIDQRYILGITTYLQDSAIIKTANLNGVASLVEQKLTNDLEKIAMGEDQPGMPGMDQMGGGQPPMPPEQPPMGGGQPSPEELGQVAQSGLTENDIQAAAKVVQVIAEMKQQADQAAMAQQPGGGMQQPAPPMGAQPQQPPMPPAPQPPMAGGGMQQPPMG